MIYNSIAVLLSRTQAYGHLGQPAILKYVRPSGLLIVRMSEEANKEATRISKIALGVAMAV